MLYYDASTKDQGISFQHLLDFTPKAKVLPLFVSQSKGEEETVGLSRNPHMQT